MKNTMAALLALTLGLGTLAGCMTTAQQTERVASATSEPAGQPPLRLRMAWWGNHARNERTKMVLTQYGAAHPGTQIDTTYTNWGDYWNWMAGEAAGHVLPDIIQMDYTYLQQYVDHDLLLDLTPYAASGVLTLTDVDDDILDAGTIDGKLYGLCMGVNVPALLYNKTLLEEVGITLHDNMTLAEFEALCREIYEKTGYRTNVALKLDYFCRGYGETLFEGDSIGAGRQTLEDYYAFHQRGAAEGWLLGPEALSDLPDNTVELDPMLYGTSPDTMSWCNFAYSNQMSATMEAAPAEMEVGITTWPSVNPFKSNYLRPSQFLSVTIDSTHPDEAVKVLDYFTNSVECNETLLVERGIPISSVVSEAIRQHLGEADQRVVTFVNEVVAPNASPIDPPAPTAASDIFTLSDQLVEQICYGDLTAAEAADRLLSGAEEILK